jgi:hypothetical protein
VWVWGTRLTNQSIQLTSVLCRHALPLPDGDTHVEMLWFADDDQEISAKLVGALEGAERDALWAGQKETLAAMEAAEKDDGSDE